MKLSRNFLRCCGYDYKELLVLKWVIKSVAANEFSQMSSDTCLKIEYNFCRVGLFLDSFRDRTFMCSGLKVFTFKSVRDIERTFYRTFVILEIARENNTSMLFC